MSLQNIKCRLFISHEKKQKKIRICCQHTPHLMPFNYRSFKIWELNVALWPYTYNTVHPTLYVRCINNTLRRVCQKSRIVYYLWQVFEVCIFEHWFYPQPIVLLELLTFLFCKDILQNKYCVIIPVISVLKGHCFMIDNAYTVNSINNPQTAQQQIHMMKEWCM